MAARPPAAAASAAARPSVLTRPLPRGLNFIRPTRRDTPEGYELNTAEKSKGGREKLKQT